MINDNATRKQVEFQNSDEIDDVDDQTSNIRDVRLQRFIPDENVIQSNSNSKAILNKLGEQILSN